MGNRKGFTLIELLIVVVIVGTLAAIAIPKFTNTKEKSVLAAMKSDLRKLVTAQEAFYRDNQTYATAIGSTQGATTVAFEPSGDNVIRLSSVSVSGWAAQATNAALKGAITKCGIFIGSARAPHASVTSDGVPACY